MRGGLRLLIALGCAATLASHAGAASAPDCRAEETGLAKDESELPRLEVANPADQPTTCITLETLIAFAGRVKSHVGHCPASSYVAAAADWEKTRVDYGARFVQNRCKRTF